MKSIVPIILFLAAILGGCNNDQESNMVNDSLTGKAWRLHYIQNTGVNTPIFYPGIPEKITVEFKPNKQLVFDGVCNTGGASFSAENDKITAKSLVTTEIYCSNINWEEIAGNGLTKAYRYEISGKELIIYSNAGYKMAFK